MKIHRSLPSAVSRTAFALGCALTASCICTGPLFANGDSPTPGPMRARKLPTKPAHAALDRAVQAPNLVAVKLKEGRKVRLRDGALLDLDVSKDGRNSLLPLRPLLNRLSTGRWERMHYGVTEERLDEMQAKGQSNTAMEAPNLNLWFRFALPEGVDAAAIIDELNALDLVEIAEPVTTVYHQGLPGDYSPYPAGGYPYDRQGYINPANYGSYNGIAGGIDARYVWNTYGTHGAGIAFGVVGYNFRYHIDLPGINDVNANNNYAYNNDYDHDTAALGEVLMQNNPGGNFGGIGIAYDATAYYSHICSNSSLSSINVPGAISNLQGLPAGSVVLIELETPGPAHNGRPANDQFGDVPIEWEQGNYQAIVTLTNNGISVIEPAGNGRQNLDDGVYNGRFTATADPNIPNFYTRNTDSGAIIVGGGFPDIYAQNRERGRFAYSNFGLGVDLQGWGAAVLTLGYGDNYSDPDPNHSYTGQFSGTSSASPIVGGAVVLMNAVNVQQRGIPLSPRKVRKKLKKNGNPQGGYDEAGISGAHIGPLPDLYNGLGYLRPPAWRNAWDDDPNQYPMY